MAKTPNGKNWASGPQNFRNPPSSVPMKPFPRTSMPDRCDPEDQQDMGMKKGISSTGNSSITNGRKWK